MQTKHLQENYEKWINILKEEKSNQQTMSPNVSSDDSSTPVLAQHSLEEIVEAEESSNQSSNDENNQNSQKKK